MLIIHLEDILRPANKASPMPRRSPPPPPSVAEPRHNVVPPVTSKAGGGGGPMGAFWTTQHGKDSVIVDDRKPKFDEERTNNSSSRHEKIRTDTVQKVMSERLDNKPGNGPSKDFEINFFENSDRISEKPRSSRSESTSASQGDAFNAFVAEFKPNMNTFVSSGKKSGKEELLEAEVERLKEQLKQVNLEKAEITSKYEKLSAICRSQRQELQELKQALASRTTPNKDFPQTQTSPSIPSASTPPVYSYSAPFITCQYSTSPISVCVSCLAAVH